MSRRKRNPKPRLKVEGGKIERKTSGRYTAEETSTQFAASDRVKGIDPSWCTNPHSTFLSAGRGSSGRGLGVGGTGGGQVLVLTRWSSVVRSRPLTATRRG